ncbi:MAG: PAS domain S-box protein [Desulfobacterales bacterium]|nr:PAS domain S-box protein [Desulfobacterales bacterium]
MPPKPTYEELVRQVDALQAEVDTLRQAAGQCRPAEQKFAKAFHNCPAWVVLSTLADGRYVEVNTTFLKDTGFKRNAVIGRTAADLGTWIDLQDRVRIIRAIEEHGTVHHVEVMRRDRSGRTLRMLFFGEKIEIDGEAHLLSTSINITDERARNDVLHQAKDESASGVAARTANLARTDQTLEREIKKRRNVETTLTESERPYRSIVDNSLVGIYTTDIAGRMLYANRALARMFGYEERHEFLSEGVISHYRDPADRARLIGLLEGEGHVDSFEVDLIARDGRRLTALLSARLEKGLISGVLTDITERKAIETALHESEERYRRLLEGNPDAVFCHREGIIILANPAAVNLFGACSAEDILGRDFYALVHPDDVAKMKKRRDRVVATGMAVPLITAKFLQLDGREVEVEVGGTLVLLDNVPTVQTVARDISARVRADAALQESENRLRLITNHLPHAMVYQLAIRPDGSRSFLHVSDNIRQLHGLSPYDVMADPMLLYEQALPEYIDQLKRLETRALKDLATFRIEMQCRLPHGENRWFELVSTPRVRADGTVVFDGIDIDITERKEAEDQLRHSREQFKRLFTHANVGIALHDIVCDPQGRPVDYILTDVNPAYTRILGLEYDAVVGRKASKIYGADKAPYLETFAAVAASGEAAAFETYYPPMERHFRVVVYRPRPGSFATIFDDITDRQRAAEKLRHSLAYNKVLFQESYIPNVVLDPDTARFTDCNPAAASIYGLGECQNVIGKTPLDVSAPVQYDGTDSAEAAAQHFRKAMQEQAHRFEWRHQRPDGSIWDAEVHLMTFTHQNRTMLQFSLQDITAAKQADKEREKLIEDLKLALTEVRTLSGLLPICAQCKKIRDDRGYWNQIEIYIRERTDANFSHGVCPDCARELYPGLDFDFGSRSDKKN